MYTFSQNGNFTAESILEMEGPLLANMPDKDFKYVFDNKDIFKAAYPIICASEYAKPALKAEVIKRVKQVINE